MNEGETIGDGAFEDYYAVDGMLWQARYRGAGGTGRCREGETVGAHLQVPPLNTYTPVPTSPQLAALITR